MNMGLSSSSADQVLPDWFAALMPPLNTDFSQRVVSAPDTAQWLDTSLKGVQMRVLEFVPANPLRLVAQLRLHNDHEPVILGSHPDLEILVQEGHLTSQLGDHPKDWYFRLPDLQDASRHDLAFHRSSSMPAASPALIYLAMGQMEQSDTEWRSIDTTEQSNWFPGPVDGTEVLPLHGHGSGNVMLVRWTETAAFKPRIDPRGDELLVVEGAVYDAQGYYPAGSWIRNPIVSWQAWGAKAGTVIYYKNGHFADSVPEANPPSTP